MRHIRNVLLPYVIWILLVSVFVAAAADACPPRIYLEGGVPEPEKPHDSIRMDSGEITIRLGRPCTVDAVFEFFNTGETTTQRVGIPTLINGLKQGGELACPTPLELRLNRSSSLELVDERGPTVSILDLEVWVDGQRAAFSAERDFLKDGGSGSERQLPSCYIPERRWMVTDIAFPGHGRTIIRFRYKIPYSLYSPIASFAYGAGRAWKGNIGKLVIIIDCADVGGAENVTVTGGFPADSRKGLPTENLIIMEERDFKPAGAARLSLDAFRYYRKKHKMVPSRALDKVIGFPSEPPFGQPAQMSSRVHYDPNLTDPFFQSNEWSYPNHIHVHPDGGFVDIQTRKRLKDPPRLKHTANVRVSPAGYSEHPPVRFCEARLLDTNSMDLVIHQSTASSDDALLVQIRNGVFRCQYWGGYFCARSMRDGKVIWTTTKQKLTLDKKVYRKGEEIRGRIYSNCRQEPTDPSAKGECGWRGTINVRGVFKTTIE